MQRYIRHKETSTLVQHYCIKKKLILISHKHDKCTRNVLANYCNACTIFPEVIQMNVTSTCGGNTLHYRVKTLLVITWSELV